MHVYCCVHNIVYDVCLYIGACVYRVCFPLVYVLFFIVFCMFLLMGEGMS